MKIAIIGSGIAGLSSAWLLKKSHEVTIYESASTLGMDAASVNIPSASGSIRVDVPLRVIHDHYYKSVLALYQLAGIETEAVNYSGSFSHFDGDTYFRYRNIQLFGSTLPLISPAFLLKGHARRILRDYWRFIGQAREERANTLPLGIYLKENKYSKVFSDEFLLPTFAAIGTCSTEQVRAYPSGIINDYLVCGGWLWGIRRVRHGSADVVKKLSLGSTIFCDCPVADVSQHGDKVHVQSQRGEQVYDHVVLATPANITVKLLGEHERSASEILSLFHYEVSRVLVHSDRQLMPKNRRDWAPVNFVVDSKSPAPMTTIWLNAVQPSLRKHSDVFQSWNPLREPLSSCLMKEAIFERPVVNNQTMNALAQIRKIHDKPDRRIWFCGSYASPGVPLLESAVNSALQVAKKLNVEIPQALCTPEA
jgi:uncharacterized protein